MADDTGDGVGTAPTRLVLVHDVENPARNLNPQSPGGSAAIHSHESDEGKTEISEETARALVEGLLAPRVPSLVPHTATSSGEHIARFYGETLPLPAHVQPNVPATIIDVTDRLPVVPFEDSDLRDEARTEPTRSLAHDTIPNAIIHQEREDRRAPTAPSLRIASELEEPSPQIFAQHPPRRTIAIVVGALLFVGAVATIWLLAGSKPSVVTPALPTTHSGSIRPTPEAKPSAFVATAPVETAPAAIPSASSFVPKLSTPSRSSPAALPRALAPSRATDAPVPMSTRGEHNF